MSENYIFLIIIISFIVLTIISIIAIISITSYKKFEIEINLAKKINTKIKLENNNSKNE